VSDIALLPGAEGRGEPSIARNDIVTDESLQTAVRLSLFCDARAAPGDVLPSLEADRRGWWAAQFGTAPGSRLWLLARAKRTPETLEAARAYALEALQWLTKDGVAQSVEVQTDWREDDGMAITVTIAKPKDAVSARFGYVWKGS